MNISLRISLGVVMSLCLQNNYFCTKILAPRGRNKKHGHLAKKRLCYLMKTIMLFFLKEKSINSIGSESKPLNIISEDTVES